MIYPNPCNNILSIERDYASEEKLIIINFEGKLVFEKVLYLKEENIDLSSLPAGLYIVKVNDCHELLRIN